MQQSNHSRFMLRRVSRVLGLLAASFVLLACGLFSRAPNLNGIKGAATQAAGKIVSTALAAGSDSQPGATPLVNESPKVPKGALPRSFRYAGLTFELDQANLTTQPPEGANLEDKRGAYAQTVWKVTNPGIDSVRIQNGIFTLQLGSATLTKAYDEGFNSQETKDLNLVFSVPAGSTWDNATLSFAEPGKVPATLPLEGEPLKDLYPQKLSGGGEAKVNTPALDYKVQAESVDLDGMGQRADVGTRYLLFQVTVTCQDKYPCFASGGSFRVIADGTPYAVKTIDPVAEAINPNDTKNFRLAFQIPDQAKQVELQVGEAGKDVAQIPVNLSPGQ